ncbi:HAD family hydrolase [Vibrio sp. 05-20-BW147]|uniref:HAD-IA family hydrolase n=1 Tax=Vibrio sp. 05-20-BW147 TaxID=2575834 RepID=UPI00159475E5|nr:HAD-IA family hydrolase [Vibrio sp. 05-20-BW147]NVC64878.1 HAD family hydrolase [Vibrio sp. 05-20-BW147]
MITKTVKCVIFDCDGTLVNSETLCCHALVNVFEQFGAHISLEQCLAQFKGGKLADVLTDAMVLAKLNISLDLLEPAYRDEVRRLFSEQLEVMPGVELLLNYLEENGIEYCVVSNGPRDKIEMSLELTGLLERFKGRIYSAFDANSWKPDPDLLMYCAFHMGFSSDECVYIDDTPKGVEAGLNADIETFQLFNGYEITQCSDARVTQIGHLEELVDILRKRTF